MYFIVLIPETFWFFCPLTLTLSFESLKLHITYAGYPLFAVTFHYFGLRILISQFWLVNKHFRSFCQCEFADKMSANQEWYLNLLTHNFELAKTWMKIFLLVILNCLVPNKIFVSNFPKKLLLIPNFQDEKWL